MRFKQPTLIVLLISAAASLLFAGTRGQAQEQPSLPSRGAAPEIRSTNWINSDTPLRLADLRGKVVLLEFWTFDCINCIHTIPSVEQWYQSYHDQGLDVIGIHFPEFGFEHNLDNVYAATQRLNVTYPVGIDNDGATWRAYNQSYWLTIYLIDKTGNIRYQRIGEGSYAQTEQAIQSLLAESDPVAAATTEPQAQPKALTYITPNINLNVRAAPSTDSALIGAMHPGMSLIVINEQENWYEIRYNDGTGFVSADFVTAHDS